MKKKYRPYIVVILLAAIGLSIWAYQNKAKPKNELDVETRLDIQVNRKLTERKNKFNKQCREIALKRAEEIVDSMLLAQAKLIEANPGDKPIKPDKPEEPEIIKAKDTSRIEPLFEKNQLEIDSNSIDSSEIKIINNQGE